jgi:hypothetical protein
LNLFQLIVIILAGFLFVGSLAAMAKGWLSRREGLIWAAVWLAAGTTVAWPRVTAVIARALGIGRGADLLLYCSVIAMIIGFLMMYSRLRAVRRDLTLLVRRVAIAQAVDTTQRPEESAEESAKQAGDEKPEV